MRVAAGGRGTAAPDTVEFLSRGGNVRVNLKSPAGAIAILALVAEQKTYVVVESQRTYMDVSTTLNSDAAASVAPSATITRTGRRETIAGYECEHALVATTGSGGSQTTDVCLTSALGPWINPSGGLGAGRMAPWQRQLMKEGAFPLKVVTADGVVSLEVVRVEKRRVSDTLFRIPADFTKMDMPRRP